MPRFRGIASVFEGVGIAFDAIRANKVRAGLTILGVAVGVFVVVAMSAAVHGINASVARDLESAGPTSFYVYRVPISLGEACDGTDDSACPGLCQADCACMESGCSADDRQVCLNIPQPPNPCFTCASSIIFGECLISNMCESGNPHTQNCAAYIRAHCSSECCP